MVLHENGCQQGGPLGMFVGQVRSMDATNLRRVWMPLVLIKDVVGLCMMQSCRLTRSIGTIKGS